MLLGCCSRLCFHTFAPQNALARVGTSIYNNSATRALHVTAACCKNRAARIRVGKGDRPLTYEQALHPHHIGHRKLAPHSTLVTYREEHQIVLYVRTFLNCLANEIVIKRRGNMLVVCTLMLQKFYFLIGYTETLLSHFYKCPVKMEGQTLEDKAVYKYL